MSSHDKALRERIRVDLLNLVDKTLNHPVTGPRLRKLMDTCVVDVKSLKQEVLSYTLDKVERGYENDRYRKTVARLTLHFHNLVEGTYHHERHRLVFSFLQQEPIKRKLMDIGYGIPCSYHTDFLRKFTEAKITLLDQDPTAEEFARFFFKIEAPEVLSRVQFEVYDMNSGQYPGDAEVYLFLDSIEHTKNPTEYLKKIVDQACPGSRFIFSIPICSMKGLEGFHFAEWLTDEEARKWVKAAGLRVLQEGVAYPNTAVDYFAELTDGGYHNYLVLCQK